MLLTLGGLDEREGNKVTTDVPVWDNPARDRHQLGTLILAITIVAGTLLGVSVAIAAATFLNQYWFLHFPLGFYLLAQGVFILLIAAIFWFTRVQEHIDQRRSESGEIK